MGDDCNDSDEEAKRSKMVLMLVVNFLHSAYNSLRFSFIINNV